MGKKLKVTLLLLFAAGLACIGIGVGVGIVEFSAFTYTGDTVLEGASPYREALQVKMEDENTADPAERLSICCYFPGSRQVVPQVKARESLPAGTVEIDAQYTGLSGGLQPSNVYDADSDGDTREVNLFWSCDQNDFAVLMQLKDDILRDIRNRSIGSYQTAKLDKLTIYANPGDMDRIQHFMLG